MPRSKSRSASQRRKQSKERMRESRAAEMPEQAEKRRATNRENMSQVRAEETPAESAKRRALDKQHKIQARAEETPAESAKHRALDKQHKIQARAEETPEESAKRRELNRENMSQARAEETPEESGKRRALDKQHKIRTRAEETPEESAKRRELNRENMSQAREEETPEESGKRRELNRENMSQARAERRENEVTVEDAAAAFNKSIQDGPVFACVCCHRLMYRKSVVTFKEQNYNDQDDLLRFLVQNSEKLENKGKYWICTTCHQRLKSKQMPVQCIVNGLCLDEVPPELNDLRPLEVRLICQRIPFMKMVGLPKGRQKAIHGPAVNVPTNLEHVCSLLPRLPSEAHIIPLKLKRKLVYKGHHMYEYIRPQKVMAALLWLKENNPLYQNIEVSNEWALLWSEIDKDLWEALTLEDMECEESEPTPVTSQPNIPTAAETHESRPSRSKRSTSSYRQLNSLVQKEGFDVLETPADGNCFFHAVSMTIQSVGIQKMDHHQLRRKLVTYLEASDQAAEFKQFLAGPVQIRHSSGMDAEMATQEDFDIETIVDSNERQDAKWNLYLRRLRDGAWADHVAVQGMSEMLDINIHVFNTITPGFVHEVHPASGPSNSTIYLGQIQQQHYVALFKERTPDADILAEKESAEDKADQQAFDETSKLRGLPYDTLLQKENMEGIDDIYSIAPGENQRPRPFFDDEHFEELANPDKYPHGTTESAPGRKKNITPRKYFNQRLLNCDGRFAKDIDYLLAAQYIVEAKQVKDSSEIVLRQTRGQMFQNRKLTAGVLKSSEKVQAMVRNDAAFRFLKNVRGSPAYWQTVLLDVLAMVRQLGIPTWFLTLSAADMQWPEVIQSIGRQYGRDFSKEDIKDMAWDEKCLWLRSNPVTAARQFEYRLEAFFKDFLGSKSMPVGNLKDYMIRVEFQARGSPHAHTILWIEGAPKIGVNDDEDVCRFIDQYQKCAIPEEDEELRELVLRVQRHSCSSTCKKQGSCRFHFPHPPITETLISRPLEKDQNRDHQNDVSALLAQNQRLLSKVKKAMEDKDIPEDTDFMDLLERAGVPFDQYMDALKVSRSGIHIILRRRPVERRINQYNPDILRTWKGNMDLQFITDPYACIMYVTSYMLKSERSMSELLRKVANESKNDDIKDKLKTLGSAFLNNREVSAQEAAYRLLSLPLKQCSRQVVFVNTTPKEKRVSMLKPMNVVKEMDDDDEDIFCTSLLDRYSSRPAELNDMCLAEFSAKFTSDRGDTSQDHAPNILEGEAKTTDRIKLQNGLGTMHTRRKEAIIRFHKEKEIGETYYRNMIMLFSPWRDEDIDLLADHESYQDHFDAVKNTIQQNQTMYIHNAAAIDEALRDLDEMGPPQRAWDVLAPGAQQEVAEAAEEGVSLERGMEVEDLERNAELGATQQINTELQARYTKEANRKLMSPDDYRSMMRSLNEKQRSFMKFHRKWCKESILSMKHGKPVTPYRVFLSGPGGVGKSHLIKLVQYETVRLLQASSGRYEPGDISVILTAYTGAAAFNIDGLTLHSAFSFSGGKGKMEYRSPSSDKMNTMRSRLGKLALIIIDEVSMVGADLLYHLHRRLEDIMGTTGMDSRFGNVSILAVGDLYQLPPVCQSQVFELPSDNYARLHGSLWEENFVLTELTEIMRQKDDKDFAELLVRVRTATCTDEDLMKLQSREISSNDPRYPADALHVFKNNSDVDNHNKTNLNALNQIVFTSEAIDKKKDKQTGMLDVTMPSKASDTGGLREQLKIAVGARVMLIVNVDVTDGLVNGACGSVVGIITSGETINTILVEFDNKRVGEKARKESQYRRHPKAVPIVRHEVSFSFRRGRELIQAVRIQFPLTLAWACTIHKVQGLTLDTIVVSMESKQPFMPGQAYVALSRVKTLNGLFILGFDPTAIRVSTKVEEEMQRLRQHPLPSIELPMVSTLDRSRYFKLGYVNVRSYKAHVPDMEKDTAEMQDLDVMCFVETFLRKGEHVGLDHLMTTDNEVFRNDRPCPSELDRGGIMIIAAKKLSPSPLQSAVPGLEYQAVTVTKGHMKINVVTVYRRPITSLPQFQLLHGRLLESLDLSCMTIIVGDFNIDLIESPDDRIMTLMRQYGFRQCVTEPTTDSRTLVDHLYINTSKEIHVEVVDCYYTDHDAIFCSFEM